MSEITNFRGEKKPDTDTHSIEDAVAGLIKLVGNRVREARERRGIPRRVLSESSGVSPRYLAQLEAGEGNISIGLLQRVAIALDHRIEWLVGVDDPWNSETRQVADLFARADEDVQQAVRQLLGQTDTASHRNRRLCLIGLRGAGKSTLGPLAADRLGLPFVELNSEIEAQCGMPVEELMALYGQEGYRKLEAQAIERIIAAHDSILLAAAGGVVADPDTYRALLQHFHTIWIKASPEEHMARVRAQGDERPMAGNPEAMAQLRSILTSRETLYSKAQAHLDTSGKAVDQSLQELVALVQARGFVA